MLTEVGIDPAALNRPIGGRPDLDPDAKPGTHSPQINVRVTADLKQQIKDLAQERGTNPSDLAKELLTAGVREQQRSHKRTNTREKHPA